MRARRSQSGPEIRVNVQLARAVNPLLAQDLMRFTTGRSRHARLLTLAMMGLLAERKMLEGESPGAATGKQGTAGERNEGGSYRHRMTEADLAEIG